MHIRAKFFVIFYRLGKILTINILFLKNIKIMLFYNSRTFHVMCKFILFILLQI